MSDADWAPPEADFKATSDPAADSSWAPPEADFKAADTGPDETAGRVASLTGRALATGAAGTAASTADIAANPLNAALTNAKPIAHAIRQRLGLDPEDASAPAEAPQEAPKLSDFIHPDKWAGAVDYLADKAGMAKPATPGERIYSSAVAGLPAAALTPESALATGLSAAAGGAGRQAAAEAGAGPIAQTLAGLAAGSVPSLGAGAAATTRGIVRGGDAGQAAMSGRMADAAATGTSLSAGQASANPFIQYIEGLSAKGWGGAPITKLAEAQTHDIGGNVGRLVDNLSGGQPVSPTGAGTAITAGITAAKQNMKGAEKQAYDHLDTLVPPTHPIDMSGTLAKLDSLASPTPGAAQTTGALTSGKISTMRDNLRADLEASQQPGGAAQKPIYMAGGIPPALPAGSLPYSAARALRSAVGNSIDWGFAPADPATNAGLKQVYGSLTGDLKAGASAVGPDAAKAATDANSLYAANQATRDALDPIIDRAGGPEAVYQSATNGTKQGATKIGQVMGAINPDQQNLVRATVIDKLGRASGAQDAPFNVNTFLTNWTKLDPGAKDAMFGASGTAGSLRSNLDSLTNTIGNISRGTKLRNPSGSGEVVGHGAGAIALWEGLTHALQGEPTALAATAGGITANHLLARALTNPTTVAWLAKTTKLPLSGVPNAVMQLSKMQDPDAQALAGYLTPPVSGRIERANGGAVDEDSLVERLMTRWRKAKRETDASTKSLLSVPDAAIVHALKIAGDAL